MIVVPSHKSLVLNLSNPTRVTQVIPTAKAFKYKGKDLLAVPHRVDETKVLRNIGLDVPSPIRYYYSWPGRYQPMAHQKITAEFLTMNSRAFVLNDIGTGKSLSVLWALDYLRRSGFINKVLVVSPLSTLERVWGDELFLHFPQINYTVVHNSDRKRRIKLLEQESDFYIINHDGVKVVEKELLERTDIDAVVIDEIASFRNATTDRFKVLKRVIKERKVVWGMTGAPTPNQPTDAWAQCQLINPTGVPKYYGQFRDLTMRQYGPFKWVPRKEALSIVRHAMQPAVRFKRSECIDLPPTLVTTRHVELTYEQKAMYQDMMQRMKAEYEGEHVLAVNEGVKAMKLIQICAGCAYGREGEWIDVPSKNRIDVVEEIIEEAEGKVIVFVPLLGALDQVAEQLRQKYTVEVVHGDTKLHEREDIFVRFQRTDSPHVLVAHPKCMAHGLTLTAASVIVWFVPIFDNDIYEQACGRIVRPSQTMKTLIVHLEGSEIERRIYRALERKGTLQGTLLQMIKENAP